MKLSCDIQNAIEQASEFLLLNGVDHQSALRYTIFLEEALLDYQSDAAFDTFTLECKKHKKAVSIRLIVPGKAQNPFDDNMIISKTLDGLENPPAYAYRDRKNIITYKPILLIPSLKSFEFIWTQMAGKRKSFIVAVVLDIIQILMNIFLPIVSAMVVAALTASLFQRMLYMSIILSTIRIVRNVIAHITQNLYANAYKQMLDSLSSRLTGKMLDIKVSSIHHFGSGIFIQRLTDDVTALTDRLDTFLDGSSTLIQSVGVLVGIAIISPTLFVFQIISTIILLWIELRRANIFQQNERKRRTVNEAYTDVIGEIVRANREIKLYCGKRTFLHTVQERSSDLTVAGLKKRLTNNRYNLLRWNLRDIFAFAYLAILIYAVGTGRLDVTMGVVLFNYGEAMIPSISVFAIVTDLFKMVSLSCERLYQLMVSRDFPRETFGDTHIDRMRGEIMFRNVSFAYPINTAGELGRTILDHMDFKITPGEYVAIVGCSGCGKTTTFNLITKLYETQLGEICLDGINIKRLDEESIRKNVSIVTQNPYILHMSIRDNLLLAKNDATEEELIDACKRACIHNDIMRMENQYDTIINAEGSNLSGGQRQRLMIAMCILKDAPILLLDEATSALDNITQTSIQQNITNLSGTRTIVVIAHRMSTIVNCDRILFMDDGKIVAAGTHEELLQSCPAYRLLYENDGKPKNDLVAENE